MFYIDHSSLVQVLAAFLFCVGLLVVIFRRNLIIMLMGVELILNAANLSLIGFSNHFSMIDGQLQAFFVITIAAAESAIGLSILVNLYRHFGGINTIDTQLLKG
jgi:NADH:ubiquinone oxidoreductase subunit K